VYPPVFSIAAADLSVRALLLDADGTTLRFWPFGHAPQNEQRPYAMHQLVYGNPDNSLSCVPSEDLAGIQVDCYAKTVTAARQVAVALRDAFEATYNHMTAHNGEDWEPATGLYRVSMTFEFWTVRPSS
jgi:hypothetical protein